MEREGEEGKEKGALSSSAVSLKNQTCVCMVSRCGILQLSQPALLPSFFPSSLPPSFSLSFVLPPHNRPLVHHGTPAPSALYSYVLLSQGRMNSYDSLVLFLFNIVTSPSWNSDHQIHSILFHPLQTALTYQGTYFC